MCHLGQIGHYLTAIIKLFDMFRIQTPPLQDGRREFETEAAKMNQ